jgi:hypothetical protein
MSAVGSGSTSTNNNDDDALLQDDNNNMAVDTGTYLKRHCPPSIYIDCYYNVQRAADQAVLLACYSRVTANAGASTPACLQYAFTHYC